MVSVWPKNERSLFFNPGSMNGTRTTWPKQQTWWNTLSSFCSWSWKVLEIFVWKRVAPLTHGSKRNIAYIDKVTYIIQYWLRISYALNRFNSCCELLQTRFFPTDFKIYGVTGIKINRVISIHNRALRLRFEDKLHSLLYSEESDSILK